MKIDPDENQRQIRSATPTGLPKKNGGTSSVSVSSHHRNTLPNRIPTRQAKTTWRFFGSNTVAGIAFQHLSLQNVPDRRMQLQEALRHANFGNLPWPVQVDVKLGDRSRFRPHRQHDQDRKSGGEGKRVAVSVDHGGRSIRKKKINQQPR